MAVKGVSGTRKTAILTLVSLFFLTIIAADALAIQQLLALHGRATQNGQRISSGSLRVTIWDAASGGNLVYDSNNDYNTAVQNGVFDVMLGDQTNLDLNYGTYYYMDLNIAGNDLNFSGSDRKQFEASRGPVYTGSIANGTIVNADVNSDAAIAWTKLSKAGADLNNFNWGNDFNAQYPRRLSDSNIAASWDFNGLVTFGGGFGNGGITIDSRTSAGKGIILAQSLVLVNDLNAATVTAIDVNGNYTPHFNNTYDFGSSSLRWAHLYAQDLNSVTSDIGTLTLANPLGLAYGGTGNTAFASGRVPFSTGSILTSTAALYWANDTNRLGLNLGLVAPQNTLNIVGDLNVAASLSSTPSLYIRASDGNVGIATGSPTNTFQIGSSSFAVNNAQGRVGIGTLAPQNTLNVVGDLNVTGTSYLGNVILNLSDVNTNTLTSRDGNIIFRDAAREEIMRIVGDTNRVGIGTLTPLNTLNVVGDLNVTGVSYLGNVRILASDINTNNINSRDGNILFFNNLGTELARITADGNIVVGSSTITNTYRLDVRGNVRTSRDLNVSGTTYLLDVFARDINANSISSRDGNLLFLTSGTERARIVGTNGFLGLGTMNPTQTLTVAGDLNVTGVSYLGNIILQTSDINVTNINPRDQNIIFRGTSGAELARIVGGGATAGFVGIATTTPAGTLDVNSGKLIVLSDGNVGIGTTTPAARLQVKAASSDSNVLSVIDSSNANLLTVKGSGSVGVGTTAPTAKLDVAGDVNLSSSTPRLGIGSSAYVTANAQGHIVISD